MRPTDPYRLKAALAERGHDDLAFAMDCVSPVCDDYKDRGFFPFTGTIETVTIDLSEVPQLTGMERLEMATKMD